MNNDPVGVLEILTIALTFLPPMRVSRRCEKQMRDLSNKHVASESIFLESWGLLCPRHSQATSKSRMR